MIWNKSTRLWKDYFSPAVTSDNNSQWKLKLIHTGALSHSTRQLETDASIKTWQNAGVHCAKTKSDRTRLRSESDRVTCSQIVLIRFFSPIILTRMICYIWTVIINYWSGCFFENELLIASHSSTSTMEVKQHQNLSNSFIELLI